MAFGDCLEQRRFTDVRKPNLASTVNVRMTKNSKQGRLLTMPLLRELPGLPRRIFSSLTAFLGGIFLVLPLAYVRTVVREMQKGEEKLGWSENSSAVLAAGR
jgi:hypothetical protein